MADDKGQSSGGGGWGLIEIIIVLILVIALLDRLFGTGNPRLKSSVPDVATYKGKDEALAPSVNDCDKLLVTRPKPLEKIAANASYITVSGSMNTCDIIATAPDTFYIQIVDSRGLPVTNNAVAGSARNGESISFSATIPFTTIAATGTGYVIFTRISNSGSQVPNGGARIPIRFTPAL